MRMIWCWAAVGLRQTSKRQTRLYIEYAIARIAVATLQYTPLNLSIHLGRAYARVLDFAVPRLRRVAMRNLAMAFPQLPIARHRQIADGVFESIARLLAAFSRFPAISRLNVDQWIRYEGFEHVTAARSRGKGVLFATAHLGNWELSAFAHALLTEPMHVVVRPLDNPLIDRFVEQRRSTSGNILIDKREFARPILKALHANRAVGVLVDQNASLDNGVFVPFFGIPACVNPGFAKLAAHSGAAVIPGFALWSVAERRYVLRFYPEVEMTGDAVRDTSAIQQTLEAAIREYPDQWLWIHRRWKTRPPGEPTRYNDL